MSTPIREHVDALRAFNRFYTRTVGALDESLLETPYSLTEARVVFELAQRDDSTDAAALREALRLDAGYLSRILARFEADGLVARGRSRDDARRQTVRLTPRGRRTYAMLDGRSARANAGLLAPLDERDRERLLEAQASIRALLAPEPGDGSPTLRDLRAGDLGWVVERHGALYAREYGWDQSFEALVAEIVGAFGRAHDPACERGWIAELDGRPVGCIFCVRKDRTTAQLRLLLVEPSARGHGIGGRLVDECLRFAREAGYARIVLWTNDVLHAARRIYERAGFRLEHEAPHRAFGHELVEQTWSLEL